MKEKYLKLDGRGWAYRRPVPKPLQKAAGLTEFTKVLGGPDLDSVVAVQRCREFNKNVERELALARAATSSRVDPEVVEVARSEARKLAYEIEKGDPEDGSWLTVTLLVEKAEKAYIADGLKTGRKRSDLEWDVNMSGNRSDLIEPFITGSERLLLNELRGGRAEQDLTLQQCLHMANSWSPVRDIKARQMAVNQFVGAVGDREIADIKRKDVHYFIEWQRSELGQKKKTIERRVSALSKIMQCVIDMEDLDIKNPFAGHTVPKGDDEETERVPFHKSHLRLIHKHLEASSRMKWETKAILKLLALTGCRPSEIGGLLKEDIVLDHDVPHIWIRKNTFRDLKNDFSKRHVPLCGPAKGVAAEVVAKCEDEGPVFGKSACNTNSLSARLNKVIRSAGVPKSPNRLVVYSFRHGFKQALHKASVYEPTIEGLMGHTPKTVTRRYGARQEELSVLKDVVEKALVFLGDIDESEYLPGELVLPETA